MLAKSFKRKNWERTRQSLKHFGFRGRVLILALIYLAHAFLVHSEIYFSREPYNEIATNYIMQAGNGISSLLFLDAGYPPVLLRLLAWSVSGFPLDFQPVALGIFALILPMFAVIPFLADKFRPIVKDDRARFLICLAILLFPSWETRLFLSFTYIFFFPIFLLLTMKAPTPWPRSTNSLLPLLVASKPIVAAASAASVLMSWVWTKRLSVSLTVIGFTSLVFLAYVGLSNPDRSESGGVVGVVAVTMWLEFLGSAPLAPFQRLIPLPLTLVFGAVVFAFLHFWWSVKNRNAVTLYSAHAAMLANFGLLAISFPDQWTIENLENFVYFSFRHFSPAWQMAFLLMIPPIVELITRASSLLSTRSKSVVWAISVLTLGAAFISFSPNPMLEGIDDASGKASWWSRMVLSSKASNPSEVPPCTPINPLGTILDAGECELTLGARLANRGGWVSIVDQDEWVIGLDDSSTQFRVLAVMVRTSTEGPVCLNADTKIGGKSQDIKTVCTNSQAELLGWYLERGISVEGGSLHVSISGKGELFVSDQGTPLLLAETKEK